MSAYILGVSLQTYIYIHPYDAGVALQTYTYIYVRIIIYTLFLWSVALQQACVTLAVLFTMLLCVSAGNQKSNTKHTYVSQHCNGDGYYVMVLYHYYDYSWLLMVIQGSLLLRMICYYYLLLICYSWLRIFMLSRTSSTEQKSK